MTEPLFTGADWNFDLLLKSLNVVEDIGRKELGMDLYPNQVEVISSEQMIDAYSSVGMPIMYNHWSFGKKLIKDSSSYKKGQMGLAYEIISNTKPCIAYLMEDNTMIMQLLVLAHASVGHNYCFANNYMFKQWTDAEGIVDYLIFAKKYITDCESRYGFDAVEKLLDSCHALQNLGVDKYKRPARLNPQQEEARLQERLDEWDRNQTEMWYTLDKKSRKGRPKTAQLLEEPEDNVLYFIEKNSPVLKPWQKEIVRIVRKVAQYFYPQRFCVTGNHLVSTPQGILRFDELITQEGFNQTTDIQMLTLGNKFTSASHTFKRKATVIRVTTKSGKTFTGTPVHPLMILRDGKKMMCELGQMTANDHIITNLNYDIFSQSNALLQFNISDESVQCAICGLKSSFIGSHVVQAHGISTKEYKNEFNTPLTSFKRAVQKSANIIQKYPAIMSEQMATFIAFMQNSSFVTSNSTCSFSHADRDVVQLFSDLLFELFGIQQPVKVNQYGTYAVLFCSFTLKKYMEENVPEIYNTAPSIPKVIRASSKETVAAWIRTYIDLASIKRKSVSYFFLTGYQLHQEFFEHIQTLLYGFGIVSKIQLGQRMTYAGMAEVLGLPVDPHESKNVSTIELKIIADHQETYRDNIGTNFGSIDTNVINTSRDHIIPNGKLLLDTVRGKLIAQRRAYAKSIDLSKLNYNTKVENNLLVKQNFIPTTDLPEYITENLYAEHVRQNREKFDKLNQVPDIEESTQLLSLIQDIEVTYYDKIDLIESVETEEYVYDVTIPENHLFWMDGTISHNTKVLNEGIATFTHHWILNHMYDKGLITNGHMIEWLASHANVVYQPNYDSRHYSGINPYALGFAVFRDIQRMAVNPTEEDRVWFPRLVGSDWKSAMRAAATEYRDDSFIAQWLSPKVARDMKLFGIVDNKSNSDIVVNAIHNEQTFVDLRSQLAQQYDANAYDPNIQVVEADLRGTRALTLQHRIIANRSLDRNTAVMLEHVKRLWGYPVSLRSVNHNDVVMQTHTAT